MCGSENYMDKLYGNYFLGYLIAATQKNLFGINFELISGSDKERTVKNVGFFPDEHLSL